MSKTAPPPTPKIIKGEPLHLPCGGVVFPERDEATGYTKYQSTEQTQVIAELEEALQDPYSDEHAEKYHRTLADLPVTDAKNIKATMLVLSLTVWGLNTHAIARFLELEPEAIEYIQNSDMFVKFREEMFEAIRFAEESTIHGYLASKARDAAVIIGAQLKSPDQDRAIKVAQDILDRTGFRPADRVEHAHTFEDELRIVTIAEKPIKEIDL
jgi:hypothetical protein